MLALLDAFLVLPSRLFVASVARPIEWRLLLVQFVTTTQRDCVHRSVTDTDSEENERTKNNTYI